MPAQTDRPPAWKRNLPNALTLLRIVLAGVVFALLAGPASRMAEPRSPQLLLAAGLFILAAITDAADGYFARRWRVTSPFGRVMDPFADKILILGSFIMLAGPAFASVTAAGEPIQLSAVMPWMAVVILARELLVTSIRGVYESRGIDFSADWTGKAKMILQSVAVPLVLLLIALGSREPVSPARVAVVVTVWLTVAVTAISGAGYIARAVRAERG